MRYRLCNINKGIAYGITQTHTHTQQNAKRRKYCKKKRKENAIKRKEQYTHV